MLILVLYCGFYVSGLLVSRWLTKPRQALVSGVATTSAAAVAALTLWLLTLAQFIEPWISIAMTGTVALPALSMGFGLLAGAWVRYAERPLLRLFAVAIPGVATALFSLLG